MEKPTELKTPDILGKLKRPRKSHLGIDIGTHTLKILELRATAKGFDLLQHAVALTPPGGFQVSLLGARLREMIQENHIKTKRAVVGLSGKGIVARRLSLTNIPEEEIQEAVRWQARELFPFSLGSRN